MAHALLRAQLRSVAAPLFREHVTGQFLHSALTVNQAWKRWKWPTTWSFFFLSQWSKLPREWTSPMPQFTHFYLSFSVTHQDVFTLRHSNLTCSVATVTPSKKTEAVSLNSTDATRPNPQKRPQCWEMLLVKTFLCITVDILIMIETFFPFCLKITRAVAHPSICFCPWSQKPARCSWILHQFGILLACHWRSVCVAHTCWKVARFIFWLHSTSICSCVIIIIIII